MSLSIKSTAAEINESNPNGFLDGFLATSGEDQDHWCHVHRQYAILY